MNRFKTLLIFWEFYRRFVRETGLKKFLGLQLLGILTCVLNVVGISIIFPFFGIFVSGKEAFAQKYLSPYFSSGIPEWLVSYLPEYLGMGLIAALLAKTLCTMLFMGTASNVIEGFTAGIRNRINTHFINSLGTSLRREKKSRIVYLNAQLVQFSSFNFALIDMNLKFYTSVTLLALLLILSVRLTILTCLLLGMAALFGAPLYSWTRRTADRYFSTLEKLQDQLAEFLDGSEVIATLNITDSRIDRFRKTNTDLIRDAFSLSLSRYATYSLPEIVVMSAALFGVLVFKPDATQMVFIATYFYSMLKLVNNASEINVKFNMALEIQKVPVDIYQYLSTLHPSHSRPDGVSLTKIENLKFESVSVRDGEKKILDHVTLTVPVGEKIQLLGPNGSGKTSLVKCLMQHLPYEGTILINGKNLQNYSRADLAQRIAYHGQNQFLFSDTIMGNLLTGNSSATPKEAQELCEKLGLSRLLSRLGEGYQTWIHEESTQLSGGERQALCLARTLLRSADVFIIDEYANHLDASTLENVNSYLRNLKSGLILVTHDPVDFANRTFEFNHGKLVSQ